MVGSGRGVFVFGGDDGNQPALPFPCVDRSVLSWLWCDENVPGAFAGRFMVGLAGKCSFTAVAAFFAFFMGSTRMEIYQTGAEGIFLAAVPGHGTAAFFVAFCCLAKLELAAGFLMSYGRIEFNGVCRFGRYRGRSMP